MKSANLILAVASLASLTASASTLRCESRIADDASVSFGHASGSKGYPMKLVVEHPSQGRIVLKTDGNITLKGSATLEDGEYVYGFGVLTERDAEETVQIDYERGYSPSRAMFYLNVWSDGGKLVDRKEGIELKLDPAHPESATVTVTRTERYRSPIDGAALFAHWDKLTTRDVPVSCEIVR